MIALLLAILLLIVFVAMFLVRYRNRHTIALHRTLTDERRKRKRKTEKEIIGPNDTDSFYFIQKEKS